MEFSHVISETVLASAGFFSFYFFLRKLNAIDIILWGTFILSVAFAALFAALGYAGFAKMELLNLFVKKISASAGVLYLIIGIYSLVAEKGLSKKVNYRIIFIGIILSATFITFNLQKQINLIPTIGIPIVSFFAISAVKKCKFKIGFHLLLGVLFSILANFLHFINLPFNQVDTYCNLLASALICFGMTGKPTIVTGQNTINKKTAL